MLIAAASDSSNTSETSEEPQSNVRLAECRIHSECNNIIIGGGAQQPESDMSMKRFFFFILLLLSWCYLQSSAGAWTLGHPAMTPGVSLCFRQLHTGHCAIP